MLGTLKRREHIKHSKFFECSCARCRDPTELGTYASAFRCPRCAGRVLPSAPLDPAALWHCVDNNCQYVMTAPSVQLLLKRLTDEYEQIDANDVRGFEGFLHKYRNVIHNTHYLCLSAKHSLSQLYGKVADYMIHVMPESELNRKIEICRDLMKAFDIIEPGYSRLRGVTLYELHAPLMILTTRDFEKKAITKDNLRTRLKECLIHGIVRINKMVEQGSCIVCLSPAIQKCSGCQNVHYCSKDHQKQDWKQHKFQCTPARVKENEKYGRYLEATRDIKAGDIVLKEKPLITGPAQVTPPVCLGCYKLLEEGKIVSCEKCGWPFCSADCILKEEHDPECHYTQQRGEKCITVLRCLYQRDHNKKLWDKIQALQSHCEDRKNTDKWNNDKKMVADFIWKFFKLEGTFSEEEIMKCCGILQINGHEVPLLEPEYVALFDRISMVEHNCRANCNKSFTSQGDIILCAGVNISSGSHITVCYTDPMWGTEARRHHLADSKFFECTCERCSDVTELGTMYSAVKCKKKDCKGYLLPDTFIVPILHKTKNPNPETRNLDNKFWKCNSCQDSVSDAIIQQLVQDIGRELSIMPKGDPEACERFIAHCSGYLHPSHFYMIDVSLALAQMIGQEVEQGLAMVTDDRLLLKTQLCKKIGELLETLAPAETRLRGTLLFELHAAESRKILLESAQLLRHEPPELPEGRLNRQARINLIQMDELIKNLSAALPSPM
ncbi:hypothetical protein HF086_011880 [Spodoptera exigua]|uniref:MYND-type domain-containing protein n=1 Tax=Spodoptera exigua TaxID=7107 RepID=A0A922M8Q8_SPOEX|nr:hypothetical protein HF086_011880 [Spodoptera exigua]